MVSATVYFDRLVIKGGHLLARRGAAASAGLRTSRPQRRQSGGAVAARAPRRPDLAKGAPWRKRDGPRAGYEHIPRWSRGSPCRRRPPEQAPYSAAFSSFVAAHRPCWLMSEVTVFTAAGPVPFDYGHARMAALHCARTALTP